MTVGKIELSTRVPWIASTPLGTGFHFVGAAATQYSRVAACAVGATASSHAATISARLIT